MWVYWQYFYLFNNLLLYKFIYSFQMFRSFLLFRSFITSILIILYLHSCGLGGRVIKFPTSIHLPLHAVYLNPVRDFGIFNELICSANLQKVLPGVC
jgi:hypothetical protein